MFNPPATSATPPAIVLDTNVVLDWWVFADVRGARLWQALADGSLRWIACPALVAELQVVLRMRLPDRWESARQLAWQKWQADDRLAPGPFAVSSPSGSQPDLRCTDPDDQKFLDLALSAGCRWLVSRDRALLRLARRAAARGLAIVTPERWSAA